MKLIVTTVKWRTSLYGLPLENDENKWLLICKEVFLYLKLTVYPSTFHHSELFDNWDYWYELWSNCRDGSFLLSFWRTSSGMRMWVVENSQTMSEQHIYLVISKLNQISIEKVLAPHSFANYSKKLYFMDAESLNNFLPGSTNSQRALLVKFIIS